MQLLENALLLLVLVVTVQLYRQMKGIKLIMATVRNTLDELKVEVSEETTVISSAVTLIEGFSARLDAIIAQAGDPVAVIADLNQLKADLDTSGNALAAAVAANTPAATP